MKVIVEISGRQAIPVRAIPLLTDWRGLSPDQLAKILAGDSDHWPSFDGLSAHRLHPDGSTEQIAPRWWASWIVRKLQAISDEIEAKQISKEVGKQQWRRESLPLLPAGVFVWRDEFEAAHACEYGPKGIRARGNPKGFDPSAHTLDFNPQPDSGIAPPSLVLEGLNPNYNGGSKNLNQMLEWLNTPREAVPQEYSESFAKWCEIDAIDQQIRELEITRPVGITEILSSRIALKELRTERARLLAELEGGEPPLPQTEPAPASFDAPPAPATDTVPPALTVTDSASNAPVGTPKAKRRTWWDVSSAYIVEVMQAGQYATAKELYRALETKAGPNAPFDKGTGANRGSLFVREIARSLDVKTVQNKWQALRELAKK